MISTWWVPWTRIIQTHKHQKDLWYNGSHPSWEQPFDINSQEDIDNWPLDLRLIQSKAWADKQTESIPRWWNQWLEMHLIWMKNNSVDSCPALIFPLTTRCSATLNKFNKNRVKQLNSCYIVNWGCHHEYKVWNHDNKFLGILEMSWWFSPWNIPATVQYKTQKTKKIQQIATKTHITLFSDTKQKDLVKL